MRRNMKVSSRFDPNNYNSFFLKMMLVWNQWACSSGNVQPLPLTPTSQQLSGVITAPLMCWVLYFHCSEPTFSQQTSQIKVCFVVVTLVGASKKRCGLPGTCLLVTELWAICSRDSRIIHTHMAAIDTKNCRRNKEEPLLCCLSMLRMYLWKLTCPNLPPHLAVSWSICPSISEERNALRVSERGLEPNLLMGS